MTDKNSPLFIARISVFSLIILASLTILTGFYLKLFLIQSLGILFFIEFIASYLNFRALSFSIREPDYVFNYGFGKYESLATFINTLLSANLILYLIILGFIPITRKISDLVTELWIVSLLLISIATIYWVFKNQKKYFKRFRIEALQLSCLRLKKILKLLLFILFGAAIIITLNKLNRYNYTAAVDIIFAGLAAVFYMYEPLSKFGNSISQLTDKNLPEHILFDIIGIIAENLHKICQFHTMHTRQSGDDLFIEIDIILPWDYTMKQKFDLEMDIKNAILQKYPNSIFRLYVVPCNKDCIDVNVCSNCPIKK